MQPVTYYNNIKKENKRMLNEIIKNNKKQERKDLIKILKYLIDIGVLDDDKTTNHNMEDVPPYSSER
jgi:hypothetical protein